MVLIVFAVKPVQNISSEFFSLLTPTCVPTRSSSSSVVAQRTSTPNPSEYGTVPPSHPSATPIPFSKITDLSPDSPDDHKGQFIVFHCDGSYELFLSAGAEITLRQREHIFCGILPALFI